MESITNHTAPYPAISSERPELFQAGKTILVCGGSTGIGHAIARNFCAARASKVIILGRRPDGRTCDVFDNNAMRTVWDALESVGVLVWNAVHMPAADTLIGQGYQRLWEDFEGNARAPLYSVHRFYKDHCGKPGGRYCLFVSTQCIHVWDSAPQIPGYQVTKSAFTCLLQQIAVDVPAAKMQILCFHPSVVYTEASAKAGFPKDAPFFSDENLPGRFAVWAASPEAKFLHGRFVWSSWDVDELTVAVREKVESDPWYLKVGVKGL